MKKIKPNKRYSFHSISSPNDFIERIKSQVINSELTIEENEGGFDLHINSNHGGRIVYRANISADEKGSSVISGEIITVPWNINQKKDSLFVKILSIFALIILLPLFLIVMLCYSIYLLFIRLICKKNTEPTNEKILCDFMTNKMCCKQIYE